MSRMTCQSVHLSPPWSKVTEEYCLCQWVRIQRNEMWCFSLSALWEMSVLQVERDERKPSGGRKAGLLCQTNKGSERGVSFEVNVKTESEEQMSERKQSRKPFAIFGRRAHYSNKPNIDHEYETSESNIHYFKTEQKSKVETEIYHKNKCNSHLLSFIFLIN